MMAMVLPLPPLGVPSSSNCWLNMSGSDAEPGALFGNGATREPVMPKYHLRVPAEGRDVPCEGRDLLLLEELRGRDGRERGHQHRDALLLHETLRLGEGGRGVALWVGLPLDVADRAPVDATLVVLFGEACPRADIAASELPLDQAADFDLVGPDAGDAANPRRSPHPS